MFFEWNRKPEGKRRVFFFLVLSLLFHVAMLGFFTSDRDVGERLSVVEVGLVPLPPGVAGERSVPRERPREPKAPVPADPPSERRGEGKRVTLSEVANGSQAHPPPVPEPERGVPAKEAPAPLREPIFSEGPSLSETASPSELSTDPSPGSADAGRPQPSLEAVELPEKGRAAASIPLTEAKPRYEYNAPPPYPRLARQRGWEGEVLLRVLVSTAGEVRTVSIERSSKHAVLDTAALRAVRRWRFHPSRLGETPVEREVLVPLRFQLRDF